MIRDYIKNPLGYIRNGSIKTRERPIKEDVIELYITNNKSVKECSEYFGLNYRMFQTILSEYGIKKDRKKVYELQKETLLKTKGIENVFQSDDIKDKIKKTNLTKYGKEYYTQTDEYKIKNNDTRVKKYGNDPYCREKYRETCLNRYNASNPSTLLLNGESKRILDSKEILEKYIKDNNILNSVDLSNKLGCCQATAYEHIKKYNLEGLMDFSKSVIERDIRDYINLYYDTENNTRKYLDGKEIDIYIPEKKLGIEFNGDFYHNEYTKSKSYHQMKSKLAEENGIFIYHIFEYEWNTKRKQILNQLDNLLGINQEKIYARKCIIKEVDNKDKKKFLELNHMQGNDSSKVKLGLYYDNKLVSLMTFVKPRFNKKYQWELSRFCSKAGTNVIGGASKLWSYFIKVYAPISVISYSNISHTKGNLYGMLGFNLIGESEPNYVWVKHNDIKSRYQCQKHKLLEMGFEGNSETDMMHKLGYFKIYDCGNKIWLWDNIDNLNTLY